jgi:molybdopterin converting factor small subunit
LATVWIPSLLRDLTHGQELVQASGRTVGEVIAALEDAYPGIQSRLCEGQRMRPAIAVSVDERIARLGLRAPVGEQSELRFVLTVAGG